MPRQIGFHVYSVRVKKRNARQFEVLSNLLERQDILSILSNRLRSNLNAQVTEASDERCSSLRKVEVVGRHILGLIEAGTYGESANIVHAISGTVAHTQSENEAQMRPCFFRLILPIGKTEGLLILQRDNRVQSKAVFRSLIAPAVQAFDDSLTCHIEPIVNQETFERLIGDGQVQQLKFIRKSITPDFADDYDGGRDETEGSMELIVKARRGKGLPFKSKILQWMTATKPVSDLYEIPGLDFEFETVKADLRVGKNKRTLDFGRKLTAPIIDLTGELTFRRGNPTWASLLTATASLADDAMFEAYGDV